MSLIADSPPTEAAMGPPEPGQVPGSQENGGQGEFQPPLDTDLAPIAVLPVLTSKPADSSDPAADQKAKPQTGKPAKASRCFIATAAYGSPLAPEVLVLQRFRDEHLAPHYLGRQLVRLYYILSPPLARIIGRRQRWRTWTRGLLQPILLLLKHLRDSGR